MKTKLLTMLSNALMLLMTLIFLWSCKKESASQNDISQQIGPQPKLQFRANGILYNCDAVYDTRVGWIGFPLFDKVTTSQENQIILKFQNYNESTFENQWINYPNVTTKTGGFISFNLSNLTVGTFLNTDEAIGFPTNNYSYEKNANSITLVISSINNGYASGTFSGLLPAGNGIPPSGNNGPQMTITEGVFINLPIFN